MEEKPKHSNLLVAFHYITIKTMKTLIFIGKVYLVYLDQSFIHHEHLTNRVVTVRQGVRCSLPQFAIALLNFHLMPLYFRQQLLPAKGTRYIATSFQP